jgi:hypothetical protein
MFEPEALEFVFQQFDLAHQVKRSTEVQHRLAGAWVIFSPIQRVTERASQVAQFVGQPLRNTVAAHRVPPFCA